MNHCHLRAEKARHERGNVAQRQRVGMACAALLLRCVLYRARLIVVYWRGVRAAQRHEAEQASLLAGMSPARRRRVMRRIQFEVCK